MNLKLNIYVILGIISPIVIHYAAPYLSDSLSGYAKSNVEIFLDLALISCGLTFYEMYHTHPTKQVLTKIFRGGIPLKTLYFLASMSFFGVLLTDVVQPSLKTPHYIFTILGALFALIIMLTYYHPIKRKIMFYSSIMMGVIAVFSFAIGFFTNLWSILRGEVLYMLIIGVFILSANFNVKKFV